MIKNLGSPAFIEELKQADVVLGKDEQTGNEFVVYGRSTLKGIMGSGQPMECAVMKVSILQGSTPHS